MKKLQRIVSLILLVVMIIGLLPNVSRVYASQDESEFQSGVILRLDTNKGIWTDTQGLYWAITFDIIVKDIEFTSFRLPIKFDPDKLTPAYLDNGILKHANTVDQFTSSISNELSNNIIAVGPLNLTDWSNVDNGEILLDFYDTKAQTFNVQGEATVCTIHFIVNDSVVSVNQIDDNLININKNGNFEIYDFEEDEYYTDEDSYFTVEGVTIGKNLTKIEVKTLPTNLQQTYEHGDTVNLEGGRILATYSDNTTDELSMMDANVTVKTGETEGAVADINCPRITFTYEGKSVDMDLTVTDPIETVEVLDPDNILEQYVFNDGDDLPNNELYIKTTTKSGVTNTIALTGQTTETEDYLITIDSDIADETKIPNPHVSGGNISGVQPVTITYKDKNTNEEKTTAYSILVNDEIESITISTINAPLATYDAGDTFEKNGKIKIIGANYGDVYEEIPMSSDDITVTEANGRNVDLLTPGQKQLLVTYMGKTATYTITIQNVLKSIEINKSITVTYNENLTQADLNGVTLTEIYADGSRITNPLNISDVDTLSFNKQKLNRQELVVRHTVNGKTVKGILVVNVKDALQSIRIENLNTEVEYGKEIDYENAELYIEYLSGEIGPFSIDDNTLTSTLVNTTMGEQNVTITYNDGVDTVSTGVTLTVVKAKPEIPEIETLQVIANQPISTIVNQLPAVLYGELVWVNPNASVAENVTEEFEVRYVIDAIHQANYKDTEFTVSVKGVGKAIESVRLQAISDADLEYYEGQKLDTSKIVIKATYADSTEGDIVSGYTIQGINIEEPLTLENEELTTKTIQVVYPGFEPMPLTITIKPDELRSINVKANNAKVKYAYGEDLNLTGATIEKVMASGNTQEIAIDAEGVTVADTFSNTTLGNQQINVTYQEKTDYITVQVEDYVERIEIPAETLAGLKTTYNYGEAKKVTDSNQTLYINTYKASAPEIALPVEITTDMISLDTTILGEQTAKITYTGIVKNEEYTLEKTYTVTVNDTITGIEIVNVPNKVLYNLNEEFVKDGLKVRNIMASEATLDKTNTTLAENEYTLSAVSTATAGVKEITVTKTETGDTATFTILVLDGSEELELAVKDNPVNKQYYGKALDLTGGNVILRIVNSEVGTVIPMTDEKISVEGYNANQRGTQTLTINYTDGTNSFTTTMDIVVANYRLEELVLTTPTKTEYVWGEALDLTGGQVARTMVNGTLFAISPLTSEMVSGYSATTEGVQTITVSYLDLTATFNVTVVDTVSKITMKTLPTLEYNYGQGIDLTGATIEATKVSGKYTIPVTNEMISGYNATIEGEQVITVTYGGQTTSFNVTVTDHDYGIRLVEGTYKTEYIYGEALDLTGIQIEHIKDSITETIGVTSAMVSGYNATTEGAQTITVTYHNHTVTFVVTVTDNLNSITLKSAPTNTENSYGQDINLAGAKITLHKDSGNTDIPVTLDMISGYNKNAEGSYPITIEHAGFTLTDAFTVTVVDHVNSIEMKTGTYITTYKYGDNLNLADTKIIVHKDSGDTEVALTADMVSGYDNTLIDEEQELTVTYQGKQTTYKIIVYDNANGIDLKSGPTNTENSYGHAIDLTGAVITIHKNSGDIEKEVTEVMISGYSATTEGVQTITVSYAEYTVVFDITVVDHVLGIEMKPNTYKTEYNYGEALDLTDTLIIFKKDSGNTEVAVTSAMVSGYSATTEGTQTITVTYEGKQATFDVTVTDHINSIEIANLPTNTENSYGHEIDLTGATITVHKDSGNTEVAVTSAMISGYSATTEGAQTITVTYEGKEATFTVTVVDHVLGIEMKPNTYKTNYKYGEELDLTGTKIIYKKDSGNTEIAVTPEMVSGYSATTEGTQTITVTYDGKQATFIVTVTDNVYGIAMKSNPNKTEYNWGEDLDLTGATINYKKDSVTTEISITAEMVSGYNKNQTGMQAITVTYTDDKGDDYTTTFNVEVVDKINNVSLVSTPTKVEYEYGESLNLEGAVISVEKLSGTTQIPVTNAMVSGYNSQSVGNQTLTITYGGKQVTFDVTVKERVEPIVVPSIEPSDNPTRPTGIPTVEPSAGYIIGEPTTSPVVSPSDETSTGTPTANDTQKPTNTLGEKDKNEGEVEDTIIPAVIGLIITGSLLLLVLTITKKNVEIYVISAGERKLIGRMKINKNTKIISLDEYSDEIGNADIQVVIDTKVSNQMTGEELKIKLDNRSTKCKIDESDDEEYIIEIKK